MLVLVSAPRVFLWVLRFPPSTEPNISKFQFNLETVDELPLCGCATEIPIYLFHFICLFIFLCFTSCVELHVFPGKILREQINKLCRHIKTAKDW